MHIIVAGCGRVGSQLAQFLSYEAHDVVVIDKDPASFRRLGATFNGIILEGVSFDDEVLLEAGIDRADAFAAVTNSDNTNLMSAEIAINVYSVPMVISRLYYPEKELTYYKMGIDYICSTTLMADRIREKLFQSEEVIVQQDRLDIGIQIIEFVVTEEADGKPAGNFSHGAHSGLVSLLRDNRKVDWAESTPLRAGDRALVTMRKEGWKTIRECLGDEVLDSPACRMVITPSSPEELKAVEAEPVAANVVIGGCSAVGAQLAYVLSMDGHNVTVIDRDPSRFERLPESYAGRTVEGTAYDEETLIEAGIEDADAFTAVTKFDNTNLMAAEVARRLFRVPHVTARLFNPDKEQTYQALGLNYVCGTRLLARAILERILDPPILRRATCFNNLYDVVEFECPAAWEGKSVRLARDRASVSFAYVVRRSTGFLPDDNLVLKKGDAITALASGKRLQRLERYLRKH